MKTIVFGICAGVLCGCMVLSVCMMAADLWLRWQEHKEKKKNP